jgi:hypothetical protein
MWRIAWPSRKASPQAQFAEDARVLRVYLTARGRALVEPVIAIWSQAEACLTAGLTETEQALLRRLLTEILSMSLALGLKTQMWPVIDVARPPGENGADVVKALPVSGSTAMPSGGSSPNSD